MLNNVQSLNFLNSFQIAVSFRSAFFGGCELLCGIKIAKGIGRKWRLEICLVYTRFLHSAADQRHRTGAQAIFAYPIRNTFQRNARFTTIILSLLCVTERNREPTLVWYLGFFRRCFQYSPFFRLD